MQDSANLSLERYKKLESHAVGKYANLVDIIRYWKCCKSNYLHCQNRLRYSQEWTIQTVGVPSEKTSVFPVLKFGRVYIVGPVSDHDRASSSPSRREARWNKPRSSQAPFGSRVRLPKTPSPQRLSAPSKRASAGGRDRNALRLCLS